MGTWTSQATLRAAANRGDEPHAQHSARLPKSPIARAPSTTTRKQDVRRRARYGILGGTFDPPHLGHSILAQEVYARLELDRVWFIPTGTPPHKPGANVTPAAERLAMVELAVAQDERFAVSPIELERAGPSYTVDTLRALRARWGDSVELYFIVGWDMLLYLPQWHDAAGVLAQLDALVAVHRPGFDADAEGLAQVRASVPELAEKLLLLGVPQVEISSSAIRERVVQGLPIRYLVLDAVRTYIEEHELYRPARATSPGQPV